MHKIVFVSVFLFGFAQSSDSCPEFITCETSETKDSCPENTFYREKVKVHGCCPGCVPLAGEGQPCDLPDDCQPGLTCTAQKKCEGDPTQACEYYKRYDPVWNKNKYWNPLCDPDGSYAPKQCKGERMSGKCFCVDRDGRRIFGEAGWPESANMTCACSRMIDAESKKNARATLHCDLLGNFEPLQCDQKLCWCANPTTGVPYTTMVPPSMMTALPCYTRREVGAQYNRQCDSANYVKQLTQSLLWNHGTTGITLPFQNCNSDGSYHRVQTLGEKKRCVYRNNAPINEAFRSPDAVNCNCAYDKYVADLLRQDFLASCKPDGGYYTRQFWNGKVYCLDEDGFYFSNDPDDCPSV